ncbi:hypothetical protein F5Y15DRAFT_412534 [Xylariaceae sp. FL0016]|nr:hypothetical protein F5Y15DRAFT_412534 [Xylariaceae sp. FL0016]
MKGRPVDQLVHEFMFPKPRTSDPQHFQSLLHRHLILEVRHEVHSFYGHLDTPEAKYPGLDYTHRIHRLRLSRWPWHRRLFRAFDGLRLTDSEIAGLTKWEGTKWAKERYEKEHEMTIKDTADEEIGQWIEPADRPVPTRATVQIESEPLIQESGDEDMEGEEEDSDGELESIGYALNERLRARAARREAGDTSESLDDEWEQWLKNAIDSGEFPFNIPNHTNDPTLIPQALFPPSMLSAARAGHWQEIPDSLHDILRRTLESEAAVESAEMSVPPLENRLTRIRTTLNRIELNRAYSGLRLPSDTTGNSAAGVRYQRTAQPNA